MSTPPLTLALVVYRDQAYLRECLTSVLAQSHREVEVIVVDDASPDHGPQILDDVEDEDPRLVVQHLDYPVSIGEARNGAVARASGDYIWFIEATDLLPAGALAAVAARLAETRPDVLALGHTTTSVLGSSRPGPYRGAIRAAKDAAGFTVEDRPRVIDLAVGIWDKVFRLDFLRSLDLRFAPGAYGELPVTYPALLAAERISVLDESCYTRREAPNAAYEPQVHGTPFDVFAQYEEVFRFADSNRSRLAGRSVLVARMLRHYLSILHGLRRDQAEFFARMSESYRRHARGDELTAEGRRLRLQARLVHQGRYREFQAVAWGRDRSRTALGLKGGARRRSKRLAGAGKRRALRSYYLTQLRQPIEPDLAVFAAYWYRGYSCNPRAIYEKLRELAPGVRGVWVVDEDHVGSVPAGVDSVVAGTRDYYRVIAQAKYLVNNVNFPNDLVKRPGTIHVQTHHGTPLKKMGLDQRDSLVAGRRMDFAKLLRRCARWDYSITSNSFSTLIWERAYPTRYETLEVGYPRNDVLVNATDADVARIRAELGIAPERRAVLYAPTHREYLRGYVATLDVGRVAAELGPDHVVMARTHYFYGVDPGLQELHAAGRILDVARHPSVEELCLAADILITDYSALMFDYAVLDRPILIHAPDWEVYRAFRGTYFDLLAEPPGVVTTTEDELVAALRSGTPWDDGSTTLRGAFRAKFCALDDGRAAERVVRKVWLGQSEEPVDATDAAGVARIQA